MPKIETAPQVDQTQSQVNAPADNAPSAPAEVKLDFGTGRYSNVMKELFQDSKHYFELSDTQAFRLAKAYGADLGQLRNGDAIISIGKLSAKGNTITLREATKVKMVATFSVNLAKLVQQLNDCRTYGMDYATTQVSLSKTYLDWLNKAN